MPPSPSPPRLLITAGPTHEPIDAVRYLANRSSGRLGLALAREAAKRDWPTTLLLGPTHRRPMVSSRLKTERFQTTADLQALLHRHWPVHDLLIMAAAVADYRPRQASTGKLSRADAPMTLELEPTPDLLAELARRSGPHQRTIGFALEPRDRLQDSGRRKLRRKGIDAIVVNPLETMDATTIDGMLLLKEGDPRGFGRAVSKTRFARWLLDEAAMLLASPATGPPQDVASS